MSSFLVSGGSEELLTVGSVDFINPQPPVARSKTSWELGGFDAVDFGMRRKHSKLWISIFTLP